MNRHPWSDVALLALDVDGVLTDGHLLLDGSGGVLKRFFVRDGSGIVRVRRAGVKVCWITGRSDQATRQRSNELGVDQLIEGCHDKAQALTRLCFQYECTEAQVAYIGDDLLDLPALKLSGIACVPANAHRDLFEVADYICEAEGGRGAVREVCDKILIARKGER